jgi:uncharacterized membrane protein
VTHFCAPVFVFLAGTSVFLQGRTRPGLSRLLLTRGVWLVFLDLTLMRLVWTFNLDFGYLTANVIWAIGWCMILMAALVKLPVAAVGALGLIIIGAHNLLDAHVRALVPALGGGAVAAFWKILYVGFFAGPIRLGSEGPSLIVLYSLFPWIGVMAAGYAFGAILTLEPARRDRLCLRLGLGAILLFLFLRGLDLYGDPRPWRLAAGQGGAPSVASVLAFLNTTKYPASLDFLLMTLGPAIALVPWLERWRSRLADGMSAFGRVPFFFYLLHVPLIHLLAIGVSKVTLGVVSPWLFTNHPMGNPPPPDGYTWSLAVLYLVWAVTIGVLHVACRWFAGLKARRRDWWLSYL